ncbi:hypothetical protein [Pseudomonas brassicacearum]|uniref:Uncharacterized protein n=1 Tax=Pseudomonas brassicacearum TaxID=930166 RepID=A0A423JPI6_9PSED|nr:hypothetical protein [Pseudomonas brassicacearum]RON39589.1 hypothetical protein BK664_11575 [Pseudomonas brassicacearum]
MNKLNVQFADTSEIVVVSVFAGLQDPGDHPNQGEVSEDDPRYLEFITLKVDSVITDPVEKLKAFLADNPDVAEILK